MDVLQDVPMLDEKGQMYRGDVDDADDDRFYDHLTIELVDA